MRNIDYEIEQVLYTFLIGGFGPGNAGLKVAAYTMKVLFADAMGLEAKNGSVYSTPATDI